MGNATSALTSLEGAMGGALDIAKKGEALSGGGGNEFENASYKMAKDFREGSSSDTKPTEFKPFAVSHTGPPTGATGHMEGDVWHPTLKHRPFPMKDVD